MADAKMLGILFSNMHDDALSELTLHRTMGSVPFGGRYRLVDFALSNMVNSGIKDVGIITKSNYHSLMDHLGAGREWDLARKIGGLTLLPPYSRTGTGIYHGRLNALAGILGYIQASKSPYVALCDCDLVCNFDFKDMLKAHIDSGANITVAYTVREIEDGEKDNAVLAVGKNNMLRDIYWNPDVQGDQEIYMNIAIINKDLLVHRVTNAVAQNKTDFYRDVIAEEAENGRVDCYRFDGFCDRIHNMESFFQTNMELLKADVRKELFNVQRPIYTKVRDEVPAKYGLQAKVMNSLVADGCIIEGQVENSIIFRGVKVGKGTVIRNSIIMQGTTIEDGAQLDYVITDKDVLIKDGRKLAGYLTYPLYVPKGRQI